MDTIPASTLDSNRCQETQISRSLAGNGLLLFSVNKVETLLLTCKDSCAFVRLFLSFNSAEIQRISYILHAKKRAQIEIKKKKRKPGQL